MIILSSYGFEAEIVSWKFRSYIKPENKTIIILPFAGLDNDAAARCERQFILQYGFEESNIYVFNKQNITDMLSKSFDYIYVPGGDTFKLLKEIKELGISDWIKCQIKRGASYIGVSAGAYICCRDVKYIMNLEDNNYIADDFSALGIIDKNLICHTDQYCFSSIAACKLQYNNDYILINNDEVFVI